MRNARNAISDAASEISAKLSATNIPPADTKSTPRRYKAANGDAAARVTSTGESRTRRVTRDDGKRIRTRGTPGQGSPSADEQRSHSRVSLTLMRPSTHSTFIFALPEGGNGLA